MNTTAAAPTQDPNGSRVVAVTLLVAIAFVLPYPVASTVVLSQDQQEATQVPVEAAATLGDDEIERNRRIDELRREVLDYRASHIEWWMAALTILIGFLALIVASFGLLTYFQIKKYAEEAANMVAQTKDATERVKKHAEEAANMVGEAKNATIAAVTAVKGAARDAEATVGRLKERETEVMAFMTDEMRAALQKTNSETRTDD